MRRLKSAKIYFCFAVLLFVAKPFIGFSMFTRVHPPTAQNIFIKSFNKRKLEYRRDSSYNMAAIQKRLAEPVSPLFLAIRILLSLILPVIFACEIKVTNRFLIDLQSQLSPPGPSYLLNGAFII